MQQRKANWGSSETSPLSIGEIRMEADVTGVVMSDPLTQLAEKTNRYTVCDCGLGNFKVHDGRRLLDSLLQWQTVLPFDKITGLSDFEELREQQSAGPSLNDADQEVLDWLLVNAEVQEDADEEAVLYGLWRAATVFEGSEAEVRRFLLGKLS